MTEREIKFSTYLIKLIRHCHKHSTRRIISKDNSFLHFPNLDECKQEDWDYIKQHCPYGCPGDILWIKPSKFTRNTQVRLRITNVGTAKLHNIDYIGILHEGYNYLPIARGIDSDDWYKNLWTEKTWNANPWVWVIDFRTILPGEG